MNQKNFQLVSIISNVMFVALILYLRHHNASQADDLLDRKTDQINKYMAMHADYFTTSNLLADLALEVKNSDGDIKTITKLVKSKKLPGKQAEDAFLSFNSVKVGDGKGRSVGAHASVLGRGLSFTIGFNKKDKLSSLDTEGLFWWD